MNFLNNTHTLIALQKLFSSQYSKEDASREMVRLDVQKLFEVLVVWDEHFSRFLSSPNPNAKPDDYSLRRLI